MSIENSCGICGEEFSSPIHLSSHKAKCALERSQAFNTDDEWGANKAANLYAGEKTNLAGALSRQRDVGSNEKLLKDLQTQYSDLFDAFIAGCAHARKSQAAEVARTRELLERSIRQLLYVTQGHTNDGDIDCVIADYAALKKEMG